MKKVVAPFTSPTGIIAINEVNKSTKLYGVQHKNFEKNGKRWKVHQRADSNKRFECIGFLNTTGHLNEDSGFSSTEDVFAYCEKKGHTMHEFDDAADFGTWLIS